MKKVAIIRGADLNKFEMQNYYPLHNCDFELLGVTSTKPHSQLDGIKFPVHKLRMLGDFSKNVKFHAGVNKFFGDDQLMFGFESLVKNYDIVHTAEIHNYYSYQAIKAKVKGLISKVVITVWQNIPLTGNANAALSKMKKIIIQNADLFHVVTQQSREALLLEGVNPNKIKLIPYGVDKLKFKFNQQKRELIRAKLNIDDNVTLVLGIGRLVWEKGFDFQIYAIKKILLDQYKDIKLIILGKGPRLNYLQFIINELELNEVVQIIEDVNYDQINDYYSAADIFVLSSLILENWQEQYGMVLPEAMTNGKPVIGANSGAIPEVIGDAGLIDCATWKPRNFSGKN